MYVHMCIYVFAYILGEQHQELQSRVDLLTLNWVEEKQKREITEEKLNNIEEKLKDIEDIGETYMQYIL